MALHFPSKVTAMKFQLAILLLLEFLVFNANMVYMFRYDPLFWMPFVILLVGVLSCAAYMIRSERRQEKRVIVWDDAGLYLDPRKYPSFPCPEADDRERVRLK